MFCSFRYTGTMSAHSGCEVVAGVDDTSDLLVGHGCEAGQSQHLLRKLFSNGQRRRVVRHSPARLPVIGHRIVYVAADAVGGEMRDERLTMAGQHDKKMHGIVPSATDRHP